MKTKRSKKAKQSGFKTPDPTPEEIRERCWEIQLEWGPHERRRRGHPELRVFTKTHRLGF
jgi:hypothetical protein